VGIDFAAVVQASPLDASFSLAVSDEARRVVLRGLYGFRGTPRRPMPHWLAPGRYEVEVTVRGGPSATARVDVPVPPARPEVVVLRLR